MSHESGLVGMAITLITVSVILLVAVAVFGSLAGGADRVSDRDDLVRPEVGSFVDIYDDPDNSFYEEKGRNPTVRDSRNLSLRFTGANDSYLESDAPIEVAADTTWTIHQGVWVNSSATETNATVLAVGDPDVLLRYEGDRPTPVWAVIYIGPSDSYRTIVDAPSPTAATQLFVTRDGDTVTLYREDAESSSMTVSGESAVSVDISGSENLHGRLDETRTFDSVLNSSQRSALLSDPITPLPSENRTARVMYDEYSATSATVFFASADATASNATVADGFEGQRLDRDTLTTSGDYEWRSTGPELKILSGAPVDGAPAVYVKYELVGESNNPVLRGLSDAISLSAILPLLLVVAMALALLKTTRSR